MDPAKMKVVDLRSELGALGLDTKGNKPALVERLRKALEAKTGRVILETTVLDTSTEEGDDGTPRRAGPAARTRRRSSSTRVASTPAKQARKDSPESISEEKGSQDEQYSPGMESEDPDTDTDMAQSKAPRDNEQQYPGGNDDDKEESESGSALKELTEQEEANLLNDEPEKSQADENSGDGDENTGDGDEHKHKTGNEEGDSNEEKMEMQRELTEEEEWEQLNERLKIKEQERLERERKQAEEDAKRLEELSNDPVKLNRLKRKQEKKARWSNFYKSVEVTNEVLTPPTEEDFQLKGKDSTDLPLPEPEIDENKIALSSYDSDLHQYLEPQKALSVMPLGEGAFCHAWAGARATHGLTRGRVCYEVRVGAVVTTTESAEKEPMVSGLRIGWSTDDSTLHLGDGPLSWAYESTGRAVHNGEFKEYGKQLNEKDVVGVYLDLESSPCKMSYTVNGTELGVAHTFNKEDLQGKALFPHLLTKNICYQVNFGYDKYNMLTKTKIVRNRVEIPIEKVLEEKKAMEAELQRQKDEAIRKEKERREKERLEREERQRKKREEREKLEREKKEKEAADRLSRGEEVKEESEIKDGDQKPENIHGNMDVDDRDNQTQPTENGDKTVSGEESQKSEAKVEPMETDAAEPEDKQIKEDNEGEVPEVTEEQVLKGHVLDKRIKFVIRYTVSEELAGAEALLLAGYMFVAHAQLVAGPRPPPSLKECEVILMVGLPGAGKTHWVKQHVAAHPEKRYNILSTAALLENMKVDCKEFRATYEGRWDAMVTKCAKCVLKLLELARGRRRNFILDQTNVYPSAQRRKLREMEEYRRVCVCVVCADAALRQRQQREPRQLPDPALQDMKANFALPEVCSWVDEVVFPELPEAEARKLVETYRREARPSRPERAERDERRDARRRDDRNHSRDNEDRWGGGSRRWGPAGGAPRGAGAPPASRWGRERPPLRPERHWQGAPRGGGAPGAGDWGGARGRGDKRPAPGGWQRPARNNTRTPALNDRHNKDAPNQNQAQTQQNQNQQGWNQWAGGWGGWGNWNQNQAANWGNWGNWPNWSNNSTGGQQQQSGKQQQQQQTAGQQQQQQQWPANYTAQQWYQWQQWQQQQQSWQGYGQQQQQANPQDAQQAWAQYYQNYGGGTAANAATPAVTGTEKK